MDFNHIVIGNPPTHSRKAVRIYAEGIERSRNADEARVITVAKVKLLKRYDMYEPVEKTPEKSNQSLANTVSQGQYSNAPTSRFVDNRPEALIQ